MGAFNLLEQLTFYGAYHSHPANVIIHIIFVPLIWWSAVVLTCYTGNLLPVEFGDLLAAAGLDTVVPAWISQLIVFNLGFFAFLFYALYYLTLEFFAAVTYDLVLFGLFLSANWLHQVYPETAWKIGLGVHILSWYMQIHPGHLVFEGRRPALTDSFFQSLVLAPLFTWMEILFHLGYRPALFKALQANVEAQKKEWAKEEKAGKQH